MARFLPIDVTNVQKETRDAVVVTLTPRDKDRGAFDFIQGQYLTFRRDFDGQELRRNYSICTGVDDGMIKVGIKRVDGGAFSTWANEALSVGDVLDVMPPQGRFFTPLEAGSEKHYLGFAGGSGITPVLSILKTALKREPASRFTLIYANRQISSIMFREELEDLKNRHLGRLSVIHILETEAQEIDLFTGRIDAEKLKLLFAHWIDATAIDTAFICGPEPMMLTIADGLKAQGLAEDQIKFELFTSAQPGRLKVQRKSSVSEDAGECELSLTLDGTTRNLRMPTDGTPVLQAALDADLDAPHSCRAGVCSTCKAKVLEGEYEMAANHALEDYEVRDGYMLSCQCVPLGKKLVVTYD